MCLIGKHQSPNRFAIGEMSIDEFSDIIDGNIAVPNLLRVHDDGDAVFALVETAGVVSAHELSQPAGCDLLLQLVAHFGAAFGLAASLRVVGRAFVDAHEHVSRKAWHVPTLSRGLALKMLALGRHWDFRVDPRIDWNRGRFGTRVHAYGAARQDVLLGWWRRACLALCEVGDDRCESP